MIGTTDDIIITECDEDEHMCTYIFLHEPECRTATVVMALVSRFSLHDIANLNFSVFCAVFLKSRKFCKQYDNFGEHTIFCWLIL